LDPRFGKTSGITIVNKAGGEKQQSLVMRRGDLWASRARNNSTLFSTFSAS
jgi:hypothetical protein